MSHLRRTLRAEFTRLAGRRTTHSLRWETSTRYYLAWIQQDLFGDWLRLRAWGGKGQNKEGICASRQCNGLAAQLPDTRQVVVMDHEVDFYELFTSNEAATWNCWCAQNTTASPARN